jgi:DNA-binding NtrC family response regulator
VRAMASQREGSRKADGGGTVKSLTPGRVSIPKLELVVERLAGADSGTRVVIEGDVVRIGSHPSNDLVLADSFVSRFHCRLELRQSVWSIRDEGSSNGTFVDGLRVRDADLRFPTSSLRVGESVVRVAALESENEVSVTPGPGLGRIAGHSVVMRRMFERIRKIAASPLDVLVEGESGTGKELVAWEIVQHSKRAGGPLVILDCGAISPNLFESELFGHARGAFSGALRDREGAFEQADGGTIFLDEIGELPLELQAKLLRALAEREVRRVGETATRKVDVRVVAATNRPLEREVNQGRFREDLFHRLAVARVSVPPLRERLEDLAFLVEMFATELDARDKLPLFDAQMEHLLAHEWPGNVRELKNYVARMVIFDGDDPMVPAAGRTESTPPVAAAAAHPSLDIGFGPAKQEAIDEFERRYLAALIAATKGNVSEAARRAQVDRMHLHRLLQRHGLRARTSP